MVCLSEVLGAGREDWIKCAANFLQFFKKNICPNVSASLHVMHIMISGVFLLLAFFVIGYLSLL